MTTRGFEKPLAALLQHRNEYAIEWETLSLEEPEEARPRDALGLTPEDREALGLTPDFQA